MVKEGTYAFDYSDTDSDEVDDKDRKYLEEEELIRSYLAQEELDILNAESHGHSHGHRHKHS